ncbi:flavin reductase family protein [Deinococcus sp.]|uniref:flavin reductase family protein n=1 Tax=Deinococcus sp. TaxID=47478 RepID=UPI003C7DC877
MKQGDTSVTITPSILYFGTPVALISTLNTDGRTNLSVMSSAWALGDRVVLGLGADGQAVTNLERDGECVINLPSSELWARVERLAPTTGREDVPEHKRAMGYEYELDKFRRAGFTPLPSQTVRPERVSECPLQLEARVMAMHASALGQEQLFRIVETQVTRVHAHLNIVEPGTNHIDTKRWSPLLYVFRHYFGTGEALGKNFRAER